MKGLIEQLEAATEGSRELDVAIFELITSEKAIAYGGTWLKANAINLVPKFTTSLDAALTLVPDGWWWQISQAGFAVGSKEGGIFTALLFQPERDIQGVHDGPALALCIAALKAREVD